VPMSKLLQRETTARSGDNRDQRTPAFSFNGPSMNWSGLARIVHSDHLVLVVISRRAREGNGVARLPPIHSKSQLQLNLML
jgi:hypothetical protein